MKIKALRNCHCGGELLETGAEYDISDEATARDLIAMKRAEAVDPKDMDRKARPSKKMSVKKTKEAPGGKSEGKPRAEEKPGPDGKHGPADKTGT